MYNKRVPSGQDPRLLGKVKQTTCIIYDMPKDYNNIMCIYIYHCLFVWSFNNENVYFRWFTCSLCVQNI